MTDRGTAKNSIEKFKYTSTKKKKINQYTTDNIGKSKKTLVLKNISFKLIN